MQCTSRRQAPISGRPWLAQVGDFGVATSGGFWVAAGDQEWLILLSTDSVFNRAFSKAWIEGSDSLTPYEESIAVWSMRLNVRRLENAYFQFVEGLVDESALSSYGFQAAAAFKSASFRAFWVNERNAFDPGFVRYFEDRFEIAGA